MRKHMPAALTVAFIACPQIAAAQTQKQLDACNFKNGPTMQQVVAGCTAHIKSGKWKGVHLGPFYGNRGLAYKIMGDYNNAVADFNLALKYTPTSFTALVGRGEIAGERGDFDNALSDINRALDANPKNVHALLAKGSMYNRKGEYERAIEEFDKALKIDPKFVLAFVNRGNTRIAMKQYDAGIADVTQALKLLPANASGPSRALPLANRGMAHTGKKDYAAAVRDFTEAYKLDPKPMYLQSRMRAYAFGDQWALALRDAEEWANRDPDDAQAWNHRCWFKSILGRLDEALADCNKALEMQPDNGPTLDSRGLVHLKAKRYEQAIADYGAALRAHGYVEGGKASETIASNLYGRGISRLRNGDALGGAQDMARAREAHPDVVKDYQRYGI